MAQTAKECGIVVSEGWSGSTPPSNEDFVDLGEFPTTRYQGSKRKVLPWIHRHLRDLEFSTALDLFGGTGSVSFLLKRMGKNVTYNDKLRFNYLIGVALIENDGVKLSEEEVAYLTSTPWDCGLDFVSKTFSGYYFTDRENRQIDSICSRILNFGHQSQEDRFKTAIAYYALFQSCLVKRPFNLFHRKNLYLRFAHVERSFGNKHTWDRSFSSHFVNFAREANALVFRGKQKCCALNCDALEVENTDYDLVYLDPPYLSKANSETANYQRCYHFLEGVANYKSWGSMIDYSTANRRLKAEATNHWVDSQRSLQALDKILEKFQKSILVISYKKFGVPSLSTLLRLVRRHGRKPHVHTRHYSYALNNQNGDAKLNREMLIIAI